MNTIYLVGGWRRNYGDFALLYGEMEALRAVSPEPLNFVPVNCQEIRFHADFINEVNRRADLLIIGGGGLVFHRPDDESLSGWQFNIAEKDLGRLSVPMAVYAIGYNMFPLDKEGFKPQMDSHLRATQDRAELFSVRNRGTFDELARRGLDAERMEVVPDPGMFVPASPLTLPGLDDDEFLLGLNWAGDRNDQRFAEPWQANREKAIKALCEAISRFFDSIGGGRAVFIPHLQDIDSDVAPLFEKGLGERFYNVEEKLPYLYPPCQVQVPFLAGLYRQMDMVIGMRGHSCIIPFGQGTPVIGLGRHNKNRFFLREVGEADNLITVSGQDGDMDAADMAALLERVHAEPGRTDRMAANLARQRAVSEDFNRRVVSLIGDREG